MSAATAIQSAQVDNRVEPGWKDEPVGFVNRIGRENVREFFRQFAFPAVPPIDATVFHKLRGFDESIVYGSLADFDLYQRCRDLGGEAFFDPLLLTPIRHGDQLRVCFHRGKVAKGRRPAESRIFLQLLISSLLWRRGGGGLFWALLAPL